MRGTWGIVAVLLVMTSIACSAKPKHTIQRPDTQQWDLDDIDSVKANTPPTYPATEKKVPDQQKNQVPGGFGSGPSGGGSPFGGGGVGGVGPGH